MLWSALSQWAVEPVPVLGAAAGGFLYWHGRRRAAAMLGRAAAWDRGDLFFVAGMSALLIALISPVASFDTQLQWDHMLQHVILLVVAPPLILLGDPFRTAWAGIRAHRHGPLSSTSLPFKRIARWTHAGRLPALLIVLAFCAVLLAWHLPSLYNVTLRVDWVHDLEHTMFFGLGLLFWDQVIGPLREVGRLPIGGRALVVVAAMIVSWALAVVIGYSAAPLYAYPLQAHGLSAITDQQIAAGIMWVPGGAPFLIALAYLGYAWFEREDRAAAAAAPAELAIR
jgi:putative membrane protein